MERISCMSASLLIYFPSRRGHHHGWSRECKQLCSCLIVMRS